MHLELYAGNLRMGGAVSVAASFFRELVDTQAEFPSLQDLSILLSPYVATAIGEETLTALARQGGDVRIVDERAGLTGRRSTPTDVRYALFGPEFAPVTTQLSAAGFADRTLITNRPKRSWMMSGNALKTSRLKRYDALVVQSTIMATELRDLVGPSLPIEVIPNAVSTIFFDASKWLPVAIPSHDYECVQLFYPAMGYQHKNHRMLPSLVVRTKERFGLNVVVYVTLPPKDFHRMGLGEVPGIVNLQPLRVEEVAWVLNACDALIFPSLNETFSSAPLEAMALGKPVIAADIPSTRATTAGLALLFDPAYVDAAAEAVNTIATAPRLLDDRICEAVKYVGSLPTAAERVRRTLQFLLNSYETFRKSSR